MNIVANVGPGGFDPTIGWLEYVTLAIQIGVLLLGLLWGLSRLYRLLKGKKKGKGE